MILLSYVVLLITHSSNDVDHLESGKPYVSLVRLSGVIMPDTHMSANVVNPVLYEAFTDKKSKGVIIDINSPGGIITSGMGIFDTMNYIKPDVATICLGQAASMGAFLLAGGALGKRSALPNARIMIHQPLGGAEGQASDIKILSDEILRLRANLNAILVKNTKLCLPKGILLNNLAFTFFCQGFRSLFGSGT